MDAITIGDKSIPYVFVEKPWIKNTYMKFEDERLIVTARNLKNAIKVVNLHKRWIYKHYSEIKDTVRLFNTNSILFNGNPFEVEFIQYEGRTRLEIMQNKVRVHSSSAQNADKAIDRWLSLQTKLFADPIVMQKVRMINKVVPATKARRLGKWGFCRSNNTITFNSYLCMLPAELQDYIVSHEVAHLSEMNHSRDFWQVVKSLCPNYKELRKRLRNYDNKKRSVSTFESYVHNTIGLQSTSSPLSGSS